MYHLMSRGDRRERIFLDDVDRHDFIKTLAEACQKTGWQVHAACFMSYHFHLVVEIPQTLTEGADPASYPMIGQAFFVPFSEARILHQDHFASCH